MPRVHLTKTTIDRAEPEKHDVFLWDASLPGFGVRIKSEAAGGAKSFIVQYRVRGRARRMTIARYGQLTLEQARRKARQTFGEVANGGDPLETRQQERHGNTVKDLAARYLEDHAQPKKKPSSVKADRCNLDNHVLPVLGALRIADVQRQHVARLHSGMKTTPGAANRTLALLSKMFNLAEKWGLRPDGTNPCRHVERYRERKCERFLSPAELGRLGAALENEARSGTRPQVIAAIRLLIFTGARPGEILTLKWEHVDLERGRLDLPDSKTGAKQIQLNAPAIEVLRSLPREADWVLPGQRPGRPLINLAKPWARISQGAQLDSCRLHDLRHSFAAVAAGSGLSLRLIGGLLGHKQAATTQRYAHLAEDALQQAAESVAARIDAAMRADERPDRDHARAD